MKLRGNNLTQKCRNEEETKDRQKRTGVVQWLVPTVLLFLIVAVMLVSFMAKTRKTGTEKVSDTFLMNVSQYSMELQNELASMTHAAVPVSLTMDRLKGMPMDKAVTTASVLQQSSQASMVAVCGPDGHGWNHAGKEINISEENYFLDFDGTQYQYAFTGAMPESGTPAIVLIVPVIHKDMADSFIISYYSMSNFEERIKEEEYNNGTFYGIVTEKGVLLNSFGADSNFLKDSNLIRTLDDSEIYEGSTSYVRHRLQKVMSGSVGAAYLGESRMIFHTPLHINGWQLVMGVSQSYADSLLKQEVKETRHFAWRLMIVLCVFLALIVGINVLRFNKNSEDLEKQADMDLLTGLNNKIATESKIKDYIKNNDQQALMLLLDIDNFKKINDTMGHAFGDEVLRELGFGLAAEFRASDILGRTGGDEFMIFLKNIKDQTVIDKEANRVVRFFHEFKVGDLVKYSATASIGCAVYPGDADNFESLYKAADKALYKAKKRGKNQLAFYSDDIEIREAGKEK